MATLTDSTSLRTAPAAQLDGIKLHIGGWEKREGWVILDPLPGPVFGPKPFQDLGLPWLRFHG